MDRATNFFGRIFDPNNPIHRRRKSGDPQQPPENTEAEEPAILEHTHDRQNTTPPLSDKEIEHFCTKGWVVLKNVLSEEEVRLLLDQHVYPGMLEQKSIDHDDPSTWPRGNMFDRRLITSSYYGGWECSLPLETTRFVYQKPRLLAALDQLHGGVKAWRWELHGKSEPSFTANVRYPLALRSTSSSGNSSSFSCHSKAKKKNQESPKELESWRPPRVSWHVDGAHFRHYLHSREQSLVCLLYLQSAGPKGGGTLQKNASHKLVARRLAKAGASGIPYIKMSIDAVLSTPTSDYPIEEADTRAGDVLLQHPFVVHSMSYNHSRTMRIAARNGVEWTSDRDLRRLKRAAVAVAASNPAGGNSGGDIDGGAATVGKQGQRGENGDCKEVGVRQGAKTEAEGDKAGIGMMEAKDHATEAPAAVAVAPIEQAMVQAIRELGLAKA